MLKVPSIIRTLFPWDETQAFLKRFKKKTQPPGLLCISINSESLRCAYVMRDHENKPVLQWCQSITNIKPQETANVLRDLVKQRHLQNVACSWVLDPSHYKLLRVDPLPVPDHELSTALRWALKDLIDFPLSELVFDFFPSMSKKVGQPHYLTVVAARNKTLKPVIDLLSSCDLRVKMIDIPELCLRNITRLFAEDEQGLGLLWLMSTGSNITVTRNGFLYLMRHFQQSLKELETDQSLEELTLEVQRSLDYFQSQLHQSLPAKILLSSHQPAVLNYFKEHLATPFEVLNFARVLNCKELLTEELQTRCLDVIGGALRMEAVNATTN